MMLRKRCFQKPPRTPYSFEADNLPRPQKYRFWFAWDPSIYLSDPAGPRGFRIHVVDPAGRPANEFHPAFGPQFVPVQTVVVGKAGVIREFAFNYHYGPLPHLPLERLDTIQLECTVEPADAWKVELTDSGDLTVLPGEVQNGIAPKRASVKITPLVPNSVPGKLRLTAKSTTFQGISHRIETSLFTGCGNLIVVPSAASVSAGDKVSFQVYRDTPDGVAPVDTTTLGLSSGGTVADGFSSFCQGEYNLQVSDIYGNFGCSTINVVDTFLNVAAQAPVAITLDGTAVGTATPAGNALCKMYFPNAPGQCIYRVNLTTGPHILKITRSSAGGYFVTQVGFFDCVSFVGPRGAVLEFPENGLLDNTFAFTKN